MTTKTREKPILFSGPMVRAILAGRKTQTRRVLKLKGCKDLSWVKSVHQDGGGNWIAWSSADAALPEFTKVNYPSGEGFRSPFQVGDVLWVRETVWQGKGPTWGDNCYVYAADKKIAWQPGTPFDEPDLRQFVKRPSIFMKRFLCRITLEVTDVRCERLQDMSTEDLIAEGARNLDAFRDLWQELNGKTYPWDSNPWVWVYTFKRS